MRKSLFLLMLLLLIIPSALAQEKVCAYYFYGEGCHYCLQIKPFLEQVEQKYPQLDLHKLDIGDRKNAKLLAEFYSKYKIEKGGTPTLVIGDEILLGAKEIPDRLESDILSHPEGLACPAAEKGLKTVTIAAVLGAAAVDSVNPCELAVMILLLITIAGAASDKTKKWKVLFAGIAFTVAVYVSYLLMGFGLFNVIQYAGVTMIVKKIVGVLAIVVGVFNLKDFVKIGAGGFVMEVPMSWRPRMKAFIRSVASVPGAFLVGLIVSLFLLPCTSGPYIVILGMLADTTTFWSAVPLLLLYNLVFVAPMIIITVLVHFGASPERIERLRKPRTRWLHLITGMGMVVLGVLLLVGIL